MNGFRNQGALTLIAKIKPGQAQPLRDLLAKMDRSKNNPDVDVETNDIVYFAGLTTIHFARFVVLDHSLNISRGKIEKIDSPRDSMVVAVTTGDMLTRTALEDQKTRKSINSTSKQFLDQIFRERSLDSILRASRDFGRSLGFLTDEMNRLVDVADAGGYVCGIAFFGKTVFSIVRSNEVKDLSRLFLKALGDGQLISCDVSFEGARLIGPRN